ncbi:MAG TPA: hypothetical protein DEO59_07560 [Balneola sp.]|jgi:hypothetical protein|nr:hypothetical protein [Balneola sp.]
MALVKEKLWWIKDGKIGVSIYDYSEDKYTDIAAADITAGDTVQIHYTRKTKKLDTDLTISPDIPQQFHDGLVSRVLEKLYARKGAMNETAYWKNEWATMLKAAKQYEGRHRDGSEYSIKQYGY